MTTDVLITLHQSASSTVLHVYAGVGALILWAKLNKTKRRVFCLTEVIEALVPGGWTRARVLTELAVFLALGTFVTVSVFAPYTPGQALAAGMGWTAGLASELEGG